MEDITGIVLENPLICFGVGKVIAAILSWKRNQDYLWCVVAFLVGWLYVFYWLFTMDDYDD